MQLGWRQRLWASSLATAHSRPDIPRCLGERAAALSIHSFHFLLPFDWLHLPHAGTRFAISVIYPVGFRPLTIARKWSHSVRGSPQYAQRQLPDAIPNTPKASSTSTSDGGMTGVIA